MKLKQLIRPKKTTSLPKINDNIIKNVIRKVNEIKQEKKF